MSAKREGVEKSKIKTLAQLSTAEGVTTPNRSRSSTMNDTDPITITADNHFAAIPYWILELGLSSSAVHLYAVLIRFSNWTSHQGYPSRARLAKCMKVSIKTVDRAKDELIAAGVLIYERRHNKSNHYTVITAKRGSDKNDTTSDHSDKNDISRGDKNDTLTRVINNNKDTGDKSPTPTLIALYLNNLPSDQKIKPSGNQLGGQIKNLLKTYSAEILTELIPIVAKAGMPLSAGTLMVAQERKPDLTPTYVPPVFDHQEAAEIAAKSVPMPESLKSLKTALRYGLTDAPKTPEDSISASLIDSR